ncbi:MAG: NYN domain-containing protein [Bacillota bacterium]|nr:NYN domain-containing protein [Bacillota bacterium]
MGNDRKFAVLIDADNVSDKYIKPILDEVSNDGVATYKRIYGDWTKPALGAWKNVLLEHSILPIQQYGYTTGKNATDSAMIIDAMDILYSGNVDGFCIVSSDSDFTRLASRLRESGMFVVGMGEKKTPSAFIAACNKFKYLDVLAAASSEAKQEPAPDAAQGEMTQQGLIRKAVMTIVQENSDEDGWVFIGDIGNLLIKRYPDFDVRNYGFKKLTPFIRSFNLFLIKEVQPDDSNSKLVYVKIK